MDVNLLVNIIGWIGVALLLVAYWLVSSRRWSGDSLPYQALNVSGAGLLIVNSYYFGPTHQWALTSSGSGSGWLRFTAQRKNKGLPIRQALR
jgi:hypothetical protein